MLRLIKKIGTIIFLLIDCIFIDNLFISNYLVMMKINYWHICLYYFLVSIKIEYSLLACDGICWWQTMVCVSFEKILERQIVKL